MTPNIKCFILGFCQAHKWHCINFSIEIIKYIVCNWKGSELEPNDNEKLSSQLERKTSVGKHHQSSIRYAHQSIIILKGYIHIVDHIHILQAICL